MSFPTFSESKIKTEHRKMLTEQAITALIKAVHVKPCKASKGKGKAVPLQAWSGPEGSRKLRFPHFMTMAQEGGKVVSLTHWSHLPPGNSSGTHFC